MKKRGFLLAVAFLLLIPAAIADYDSIYSGTVIDGQKLNVDGTDFRFIVEPIGSKVYVEFSNSGVIIPAMECRTKESFYICTGNISQLNGSHNAGVTVQISQIKSKISSSHKIDKKTLLIGEEAIAQLSIQNIADITAKSVIASVQVPGNLQLIEVTGCKNLNGNILFVDDITATQTKTCIYKLKGVEGGDFKLMPQITYFDGVSAINLTSQSVTGKVYNDSLKISLNGSNFAFEIDNLFNLTLNIENLNEEYGLNINFLNVLLPDSFVLVKQPKGILRNSNLLTWGGHLNAKEKVTFLIELQGSIAGNHSISIESTYKISTFLRSLKETFSIEHYCSCPFIQYKFIPGVFEPGKQERIKAMLTNPNQLQDFSNIGISYSSSMPDMRDSSVGYQKLMPLESISILDAQFTVPEESIHYNLNITAKYKSNNQFFAAKENIVIRASPLTGISEMPSQENNALNKTEMEKEPTQTGSEGVAQEQPKKSEINQSAPKSVALNAPPKSNIKTYILLFGVAITFFLLVSIYALKKRYAAKQKPAAEGHLVRNEKDAMSQEKEKMSIGEMFALTRKNDAPSVKPQSSTRPKDGFAQDNEFRRLEEEINKLGNIFEEKKMAKELGFFRRFFRKK